MARTIATFFLIAVCEGFGQTPPAFETASVKPNVAHEVNGEGRPRASVNATPGYLSVQNSTLSQLIQWAYNVQAFQVSGPSWIDSERYDVSAKAAGPASKEQLRLMLQTLLKERFQLALRRETKELPGYALVVAKGGPKLRESTTEGEPATKQNRAIMTAERVTMPWFAETLTNPLRSPVIDKTGLSGRYDFTIDISKYVTPSSTPDEMTAGLSECLQQELGLRVEARKLPLEMLVVEHAEKMPVGN
jgi:uncharacterized protein (TIGR03435 family)